MQIELAAVQGPQAKVFRLLRLTRIFATELLGSFAILPYGTQDLLLCCIASQTYHTANLP